MSSRRLDMRGSSGFSLIEVMVAAMLLAVGVLALVAAIDGGRRQVDVAERLQIMQHEGQAELERLMSMGYAALAHATAPSASTDPNHPDSKVVTGSTPRYEWGSSSAQAGDLVTSGSLGNSLAWSDRTVGGTRLRGTLHRYITWADTDNDLQANEPLAKRVTVAVTIDGDAPPHKFIRLTSLISAR